MWQAKSPSPIDWNNPRSHLYYTRSSKTTSSVQKWEIRISAAGVKHKPLWQCLKQNPTYCVTHKLLVHNPISSGHIRILRENNRATNNRQEAVNRHQEQCWDGVSKVFAFLSKDLYSEVVSPLKLFRVESWGVSTVMSWQFTFLMETTI